MNCERIPEPQIELLHPMSRGLWVVCNVARCERNSTKLCQTQIVFVNFNLLPLVLNVTVVPFVLTLVFHNFHRSGMHADRISITD